jgi:predicted amidophosphoribosyltransferase
VKNVTMSLLLPTRCAGCGAGGQPLCPVCAAPLRDPPRPHSPTPRPSGLPPLWTAGTYEGPLRAALVAYKERGRRDLCVPLATALAAAAREASLGTTRAALARGAPGSAVVALVPVPSRRAAARRRGGDHVVRLARTAAGLFGGAALVCPALRPVGRVPDAAGLDAARRLASRRGSLALRAAFLRWLVAGPQPPPVLLIDDLVTTGATLAEAAHVLRRGGVCVNAAVTIFATERNQRAGPL